MIHYSHHLNKESFIKPYEQLTISDFDNSRLWYMEDIKSEMVKPIENIDSLESDEPYICKAKYILNNGKEILGYCVAYDSTGHYVFDEKGNSYLLSTYLECPDNEAIEFSKYIGLNLKEIFPISFIMDLKVFGRNDEGYISTTL